MTVKEKAPAKINLYLDILGKRADGFHDIETVMQTVSLSDEITVEYENDGQGRLSLELLNDRSLPHDENNIVVRAAQAFLKKHNPGGSLKIALEKNIPIAAGLAGGSADAAATLRAMNKLFGAPLSHEALLEIAEQLGSDVPFCLVGGRAICRGRGEKMTPITDYKKAYVLIAKGDESIATPAAYSLLDKAYSDFSSQRNDDGRSAIFAAIKAGMYDKLYNVFEDPILSICPESKLIKRVMIREGALAAQMSGSGPAIFGIFSDISSAKTAMKNIEKSGIYVFFAEIL